MFLQSSLSRVFLLLQLFMCSWFCSCNRVLREHSSKRNSVILAEAAQLQALTSYVIAQSPLQLFRDWQLEPFISRSSSFPGEFANQPPSSRTFDNYSDCLWGSNSLCSPKQFIFLTAKWSLWNVNHIMSPLCIKSFNGFSWLENKRQTPSQALCDLTHSLFC